MSETKKPKLLRLTTPPMTLKYAWLQKPDDKYKKYSVNALADLKADAKVAEFIKDLETKCREEIQKQMNELPEAKRKHIEANWKFAVPFSEEKDAEYKPTGLHVLKVRSNSDHKPTVLTNIRGTLCSTERPVFNGSVGQVQFLLNPYFDAAKERYGCSLLLTKVNVHTFAQGTGNSGGNEDFDLGEDGAPQDINEKDPLAGPPPAKGDF